MKTILITGCAGLLGANFSRHLTSRGYTVIGVDDLSGGYIEFVDGNCIFRLMNLLDSKKLEEVFDAHDPDCVFHFAAYAAEGLSPFIRRYNYTNNLICGVNVINECIKHDTKKIVFTSSMSVYGHGNPPFTETQQQAPIDPYGIAKYAIEMDLKEAKTHFGLNYTIVRPHNVVGVYQNIWDRYRNVIGIWIRNVLAGGNIRIFGDGLQTRAFSDIQYYMPMFETLIEGYSGEVFNLGSDNYATILDVAKMVQKVSREFGKDPNIIHVDPRHEVKHAYCDHAKAKVLLGFSDSTNLDSLVRKMMQWASEQPDRTIRHMEYEVTKGLYEAWK